MVVPYIGTWIETSVPPADVAGPIVVPYIGTWIETTKYAKELYRKTSRTLYRYVD